MIICREIIPSDRTQIIALLTVGFDRGRAYWLRAWDQLETRASPVDCPKYGYLLQDADRVVGVVLLIFSILDNHVRCNISSWYVDPEFRPFAAILAQRAARLKHVTYFNVSPAPHTWRILERQGFRPYASGRMVLIPGMNRLPRQRFHLYSIDTKTSGCQNIPDGHLLRDHTQYGCLSVVCEVAEQAQPFVFRLRQRYGLRFARLLYCHSIGSFTDCSVPLGRFLARRGYPVVVIDCDHPISGIVGWHYDNRPRYIKGEHALRVGDLAYSELALFG